MNIARLIALSGIAVLGASACSGDLTDPVRPSFVTQTETGALVGYVNPVTPSTNEANYANGWAHVLLVDAVVGQVELNFVSLRGFFSCFEYRADDEANTRVGDNPNLDILDGRWTATCRNNSSAPLTINAQTHVDVRMVYGAETDERFDWTRFYVLSLENKDQCRNGQWEAMGFKNLGQCIRFVETGKDSRIGQ